MPHNLRLLIVVPLAVAFAACGSSIVGGGTTSTTSAGGGGEMTSASGTGGRATVGSSSVGGAGAGGVAATTSASASSAGGGGGMGGAPGTGGVAVTASSSAGGAGTGGAAATTSGSTSASTSGSSSASTSASTSVTTSASTGGFVCFNDADCPGNNTPCLTHTCSDGTCGASVVVAGADALTQTPGDCLKDQCDDQGNVVSTPDSTDVPGVGNPCVTGSCVGGVPTLTPLTGGACNQNGGNVCDSGACVECLSSSDCPGQNDCNFAVCVAGQCHLFPNAASCQNPPPCHESPALCTDSGCSYAGYKSIGTACPGGVCDFGVCETCAQFCVPPLPCQLLVCDSSGPLVACTYPSAPQGTSCPGGTCNGNGACL
jgi:hypothetical protein